MKMDLGLDLSTAASVAAKVIGAGRGGASIPGGSPGAMPGVTVNPSFQQAFTPQFSPTMQQQQDSPGATQAASPVQYATGGQTAAGEGATIPAPGMAPIQPPIRPVDYIPSIQQSDQYSNLIMWGIIAATVLGVASMYRKKPQGRSATVKRARKRVSKKK